jgi:hypothetical protein
MLDELLEVCDRAGSAAGPFEGHGPQVELRTAAGGGHPLDVRLTLAMGWLPN